MKVFFNASLTGKKEYGKNYEMIKDAIVKSGHKLVGVPVLEKSLLEKRDSSDTKEAVNFYETLIRWIKQAEVCVFEVSYPSFGIGYEVNTALQYSKPVIALHVEGAPQNMILSGIKDDRLQVIDYGTRGLERLVSDAIDYASEQMDTRFNFFISPQIGAYLDWVAKAKKVPRAVFLRQLIEEDMKRQGYND